jgi:hypothetical protein
MGLFYHLDLLVPLNQLALIFLLPDFVKPVSWWSPLVETCHCMQFSGFATRTLSEQGSWFFHYFYNYHLTDLTVYIDLMCCLEGTG